MNSNELIVNTDHVALGATVEVVNTATGEVINAGTVERKFDSPITLVVGDRIHTLNQAALPLALRIIR